MKSNSPVCVCERESGFYCIPVTLDSDVCACADVAVYFWDKLDFDQFYFGVFCLYKHYETILSLIVCTIQDSQTVPVCQKWNFNNTRY